MIWLAGLPVIWWVAILLADAIQPGRNLFELMEVLTEKLNHPFQFHYTEYTIKSMLVCTLLCFGLFRSTTCWLWVGQRVVVVVFFFFF